MGVRIESDGTSKGTKVYDADGELVPHVRRIEFTADGVDNAAMLRVWHYPVDASGELTGEVDERGELRVIESTTRFELRPAVRTIADEPGMGRAD